MIRAKRGLPALVLLILALTKGTSLGQDIYEQAFRAQLVECAYFSAFELVGFATDPAMVRRVIARTCATQIERYNAKKNNPEGKMSFDESDAGPPKHEFASAVIDGVMKQYDQALRAHKTP